MSSRFDYIADADEPPVDTLSLQKHTPSVTACANTGDQIYIRLPTGLFLSLSTALRLETSRDIMFQASRSLCERRLIFTCRAGNLEKNAYGAVSECAEDIRLIWTNCKKYNQDGSARRAASSGRSAVFFS